MTKESRPAAANICKALTTATTTGQVITKAVYGSRVQLTGLTCHILTNFKRLENLKLKRKERTRRREYLIYNKYNVCALAGAGIVRALATEVRYKAIPKS
jgi:hypothetical protein